VRHLLAHASGVGPADDTVLAAPGKRRIYSTRGFDLLGDLVSTRVGKPFPEYVAAEVFEPLGMAGTRLAGSPAHAISGPLGDLAALGGELLVPTLAPGLRAEATRVAFPGIPGVLPGFGRQAPNDWGLGFEIRNGKNPHWTGSTNSPATFGHFGQSGSFLWSTRTPASRAHASPVRSSANGRRPTGPASATWYWPRSHDSPRGGVRAGAWSTTRSRPWPSSTRTSAGCCGRASTASSSS
jgi:CubicO group peptidase (beta-lactamase class C family)